MTANQDIELLRSAIKFVPEHSQSLLVAACDRMEAILSRLEAALATPAPPHTETERG